MDINGDAAAVVRDRGGATVLMQRDNDLVRFAGEVFVDRVVDDFPEQVMQSAVVDSADVHRWPTANRFQPFEDFDIAGGVIAFGAGGHGVSEVRDRDRREVF